MGTLMEHSSANSATSRGGFRLLDAMILVAATAMGCGLTVTICRAANREPFDEFTDLFRDWPSRTWWDYASKPLMIANLVMPLVMMVSLALISILLRTPRPRWRRLARRPALVAVSAAGLAIAFVGLPVVVAAPTAGAGRDDVVRMLVTEWNLCNVTMFGGLAVLVSWMTLLVGGHWYAERSGGDRLGRALGVCWIVAGFAVGAGWFIGWIGSQGCELRLIHPSATAVIGQKTLHLVGITIPIVAGMTLALIPIHFLVRRRRRLSHQPGHLASIAAGLAMTLLGLPAVAFCAVFGAGWMEIRYVIFDEECMTFVAKFGGMAVSASWTTLIAGRRWRAEPSGVDRLGRAMGFCWMVAGLAVVNSDVLIETEYLLTYRDSSLGRLLLETGGNPPERLVGVRSNGLVDAGAYFGVGTRRSSGSASPAHLINWRPSHQGGCHARSDHPI